ncbi:terminase small subunit [Candidatus Soleaferrea massiliensis]|uniref:terminase small subunit n=1 Tax=Candidatus Soleaferrea massiliensis TaxID=1470354 RepID=UPI00069372FC|nr:terminase small subunit [Candidatus Soleaferrea massiliensis]
MPKTTISAKERLFCYYFSRLQNHREALLKAGYTPEQCSRTAARLLQRRDIRRQIDQFSDKGDPVRQQVEAGLRRIAFGCVTDAFKLVCAYQGETPVDLDGLDLYNVSEIKDSGKGLEIRFFDRMKALEMLSNLEQSRQQNEAGPLYEALERSAQALNGERACADD